MRELGDQIDGVAGKGDTFPFGDGPNPARDALDW